MRALAARCTGFPFNIPLVGRHPQYTGVLLSIWGGTALTADEAATSAGFPSYALIWSAFYIFTSIVEMSESKQRGASKSR